MSALAKIEEISVKKEIFAIDSDRVCQLQAKPRCSYQGASNQNTSNEKCQACGFGLPHRSKTCPAIGQTCRNCGGKDHF